tara:strand:+ start:19753 stop:20187 length:435 start_codon:yes stop_codon:yes gene_type:complete
MDSGIERALKTVDIKGKAYVTVNERIKYFREHFTGYKLISEIVYHNEVKFVEWHEYNAEGKKINKSAWTKGEICFKASIFNEKDEAVATGYAMEKADSSYINKTSYIENCETSAWGRALANFAIGVDSSVASADEVANAIKNQK